MNLSRPIRAVIPSLHGDVLSVLARADQPMTGRAVARLVGDAGSTAGVARVLKMLVQEGLVRCTSLGPASLYELNRAHLAADAIVALSRLREALVDRLRRAVAEVGPPLTRAILFGSLARGGGDASSDVDVLLVHGPLDAATEQRWDDALARLGSDIRSWSGNPPGIVVYAESELTDALTAGDEFVRDVLEHGVRLL